MRPRSRQLSCDAFADLLNLRLVEAEVRLGMALKLQRIRDLTHQTVTILDDVCDRPNWWKATLDQPSFDHIDPLGVLREIPDDPADPET